MSRFLCWIGFHEWITQCDCGDYLCSSGRCDKCGLIREVALGRNDLVYFYYHRDKLKEAEGNED